MQDHVTETLKPSVMEKISQTIYYFVLKLADRLRRCDTMVHNKCIVFEVSSQQTA